MIHKVSNNFGNGFKNEVNDIQNLQSKHSSYYTEEDYNNIVDVIENFFCYKVIKLKNNIHSKILTGNDDLRVYDKYGERITTYYGNNWGEYALGYFTQSLPAFQRKVYHPKGVVEADINLVNFFGS